jgi:hypothetical protein
MKRIKWTVLSLAIIVSVCGAFATRPKFDCTTLTQYYFTGGTYMPAGQINIDYVCTQGSIICTYYTTNGGITYTPCIVGVYDNCQGCAIKKTVPPAPQAAPTH